MPISVICPECSGKLRVADNLVGKKIKCPKCSATFPVGPEEDSAGITKKAPSAASSQAIKSTAPTVEELEEVEESEQVEELEEVPRVRGRRIRRDSGDEAISTIIPYKNARALTAYYLGVFSLIPCLGLLLGPAALVLGILGIRYVKANPTAKGTGHAIAGIVMGSLTSLLNWGATLALIVAFIVGMKK
ncbi:MAG TPA: DUF4190 domain-containing protein [Gemmataceae bacterium]|jgi:DNA-directed RNA polymerase subunit M/transcription elongation factor TFIIS